MAQITDFTEYQLKTGRMLCVDDMLGAFDVIGVLQALTDISQEINAATGVWTDDFFFPGVETRQKKIKDAAAMLGNDALYNIHALICLQADNMKAIAEMMEPYIEEPNAKKKQELYDQRQELAKEYTGHVETIMSKYLKANAELYKEQAEKIEQEQRSRTPQGDS